MPEILLDVRRLGFARHRHELFCDLSFQVRRGECWAILGPNGTGKTTLLSCLAGLLPNYRGEILLADQNIAHISLHAQAKLRAFFSALPFDAFSLTVFDAVLAGRHPHFPTWQWENEEDYALTCEALALFGLEALRERDVRTLSAGERQRVALAAMLTQQPQLYLLDEPAVHLDPGQQITALDAVCAHVKKQCAALLMVLHEPHLATRYADHVILLNGKESQWGDAAQLLSEAALSQLFHTPMIALEKKGVKTFVPSLAQSSGTASPSRR